MDRRNLLTRGTLAVSALALGMRPLRAYRPDLRFGYAALTWGGNDERAIDDIAALGFRGIQLRSSALEKWGDRPDVLRALLAERGLTMVALSSGTVRLDPAFEAEDLALHLKNARFVLDVGGLYLQVLDERPKDRAPTGDDFRRMGRLLTELGRRTADLGIPLGYHNHMGNLGQAPDEVAQVIDAADTRFVKLELDTAHYQQAGGDPVEAVNTYADRLLFLHIKDLESPVPGKSPEAYRFVELGRGKVDFPEIFAALERVGFEGWGIVELDSVPDSARTPKESGVIARQYLETLGFEL
jgi:inosose dehydratase